MITILALILTSCLLTVNTFKWQMCPVVQTACSDNGYQLVDSEHRLLRSTVTDQPQANIEYHGGLILTGTVPVYLIFYGEEWTKDPEMQKNVGRIMRFVNHIDQSEWYQTTKKYNMIDGHNRKIPAADKVHVAGLYIFHSYAFGKELNVTITTKIIKSTLKTPGKYSQKSRLHNKQKKFDTDPNGIYMLITDKQIYGSKAICGSHSWFPATDTKQKIPYAVVKSNKCKSKDAKDQQLSGTMSVLAHELVETITDPFHDAWHDNAGQENADKCANNYDGAKGLSFKYNFKLVSKKQEESNEEYLLTQVWDPVDQKCSSAFSSVNLNPASI